MTRLLHGRPRIPSERFYFGESNSPTPNMPISPGVSAVIFGPDRSVLLMKRAQSEYWSLPGGRLDIGESAQECCIRETLEETGLETRIVRLISVNTDPRSIIHYPDGNIFQSFVLCFEAEIVRGDLTESTESEAFRWCRREDLDQILVVPDSRQNILDAWEDQIEAFIR